MLVIQYIRFEVGSQYIMFTADYDPSKDKNTCPICGKKYSLSTSMKTHLLSHQRTLIARNNDHGSVIFRGNWESASLQMWWLRGTLFSEGEPEPAQDNTSSWYGFQGIFLDYWTILLQSKLYYTERISNNHCILGDTDCRESFPCSVCGKELKSRLSCQLHERTHLGTF